MRAFGNMNGTSTEHASALWSQVATMDIRKGTLHKEVRTLTNSCSRGQEEVVDFFDIAVTLFKGLDSYKV